MRSEDLAQEVGRFIEEVQGRVMGTGNDQYSQGDTQRFEAMKLAELLEWIDEEIQDVAAYATMLSIRMRRVKEAIAQANLEALQKDSSLLSYHMHVYTEQDGKCVLCERKDFC